MQAEKKDFSDGTLKAISAFMNLGSAQSEWGREGPQKISTSSWIRGWVRASAAAREKGQRRGHCTLNKRLGIKGEREGGREMYNTNGWRGLPSINDARKIHRTRHCPPTIMYSIYRLRRTSDDTPCFCQCLPPSEIQRFSSNDNNYIRLWFHSMPVPWPKIFIFSISITPWMFTIWHKMAKVKEVWGEDQCKSGQ